MSRPIIIYPVFFTGQLMGLFQPSFLCDSKFGLSTFLASIGRLITSFSYILADVHHIKIETVKDGLFFYSRAKPFIVFSLNREIPIVSVIYYPFSSGVSMIFWSEQEKRDYSPTVHTRESRYQVGQHRNRSIRSRISANNFLLTATFPFSSRHTFATEPCPI